MTAVSFKVKSIDLFNGVDGSLKLFCELDGQTVEKVANAVQNANDSLKQGKNIAITIDTIKKTRSLDANAYFHVLCDKIACQVHMSMDEVKVNMVLSYGTPEYIVSVPRTADIRKFWAYAKYIDEDEDSVRYMLYKATHTLDTSEMSRLIEGTIQEAQQLGINVIPPEELKSLYNNWRGKHDRRQQETGTSTSGA